MSYIWVCKHLLQLRFSLFSICLLCGGSASAQLYTIAFEPDSLSEVRAITGLLKDGNLYDTVYIKKQIPEIQKKLLADGYIFQKHQGYKLKKDTCTIQWYLGPQLTLLFEADSFGTNTLAQAGLSNIRIKDLSIDSSARAFVAKSISRYLSNNGYPLSKVYFTRSFRNGDTLITSLQILRGPHIFLGDIQLPEKSGISKAYLRNMLGLHPDALYNASQVVDIERKINNLSFLKLQEAPKVSFLAERATIFLPITDQKASKFDFLIGVLPSVEDGIRRWNINGEFLADFVNKFGIGERMGLQFKRLTNEDQFLKVNTSIPFVFSSPFGLNGDFEVKRNRNISNDLISNIGASYFINTQNHLKLYWTYKSSALLNPEIDKIKASGNLPKNLDLQFHGGSLEYIFSKLDYIFNPRKGLTFRALTSLGNRTIIRNQQILQIEGVDFAAKYDSLGLRNLQINVELEFDHFTPAFGIGTFRNRLLFASKYNNGTVIQNELYRIGGNKLLRGFDELSFLSDLYMMYSGEFRLILDRNSYLTLPFVDIALLRNRNNFSDSSLIPAYGLGMGMGFATKAGIFNISFAAGNYNNVGFDFANTKIHFGYLNLF